MAYKRLFILVEGGDDIRFFGALIKPFFEGGYDNVVVREWRQQSAKYIASLIRSIERMGADLIFVADIDRAPCIGGKKAELETVYHVCAESVIVVVREIEGWYLAGLDNMTSRKFGLACGSTDNVTKEDFNRQIPRRYDSRISFMIEILEHFAVATACRRNRSFKYFTAKYSLTTGGTLA
jgi:hypothetical protein